MNAYIANTKHLPPAPALMLKLMECFQNPDLDVDEIVDLMELDPSVTTEVLKCSNSSFFMTDEPVVDISEAVLRLGFYELYQISMTVFGRQTMASKNIQGINVEALWRHSALTAVSSGVIARELDNSEGAAFTAGLLHDVGKIVFASAEGLRYAELIQNVNLTGGSLIAAEKAAFGFDHCEIGACLLEKWKMPAMISAPVLRHHNTSWLPPHEQLSAIVCLGNLMAHCIDGASPDNCCALPEAVNAMELLGLKHENMPAIMSVVQSDTKRLKNLIPAASTPATVAA